MTQGVQVEEDPEDFGTQGKTHRVKKVATEKSKKSMLAQTPSLTVLADAEISISRPAGIHALPADLPADPLETMSRLGP